jgi:hypothetical protein
LQGYYEHAKTAVNDFANGGWRKAAAYTDVNDAVVLGTMITRGNDAINIDGIKATTVDKVAAVAGTVLPVLSGSAAKKGLNALGDALGLEKKADFVVSTKRHSSSY